MDGIDTKQQHDTMKSLLTTLLLALSFLINAPPTVDAGSAWSQLGHSICSIGDNGGYSVDVAEGGGDGVLTLAVGSPKYTDTLHHQGKVQVYQFHPETCLWSPQGEPILGQETEDQLGTHVALSCDGSVLAVAGDTTDNENSVRTGLVNVYAKDNNSGEWSPRGGSLRPPTVATNFGFQLTLSCDGKSVGVGAYGYSQVFRYDSGINGWQPKGNTLLGSGPRLTALSRDGNTLVVAEQLSQEPVRAYQLDTDGVWTQFGNDMLPPYTDIDFPRQLAVSDDGRRVLVSCPGWSNSGQKQFGALVFDYSQNSWNIVGDTFHQSYGTNVALSGNGNYVFTSTSGYHSYHDEVASAYTLVNGQWLMTGGVYELEHANSGTETIKTTVSGALFAFGTTDDSHTVGISGAAHVFFYPDAGIVDGCLPDPDLVSEECELLRSDNEWEYEEGETINVTANITSFVRFEENNRAGMVAGVVLGSVALLAATISLVLILWKRKGNGVGRKPRERVDLEDDISDDKPQKEQAPPIQSKSKCEI